MKNTALIVLLSFLVLSLPAQELLGPLYSNPVLIESASKTVAPTFVSAKTATTLLQLPFFDDFSYCWKGNYPDASKWKDSSVYVNHGYGIAPPSFGVATFDGINKRGYPYQPELTNLSLSYASDTLTSADIDLKNANGQPIDPSADKVGLSFYYQPRGMGDAPEINDSLILDLYRPAKNEWVPRVWAVRGYSDPNKVDSGFKRAFIYLRDTALYHEGFKFRFRNSATNIGNFDHWHLDYVYLNKNRDSIADTLYNDLTFGVVPGPLLKNYANMPWQQYRTSEMAPSYSVRIKNSNIQGVNMSYQMRVLAANGSTLHSYDGTFANLPPFHTAGYSSYQPHSQPVFGYTFDPLTDSTDFTMLHFVYRTGTANDFVPANDTIRLQQVFRNYYAWDDGGAEAGYYVLGKGSKIACRVTLNAADTLQSMRIYFDRTGSISAANTTQRFRITVWNDNANTPGDMIFQDTDCYPSIKNTGNRDLYEYKLTSPSSQRFLQAGTYYIGIQQYIATGITIGYDRNYNFSSNTFYNTGKGWAQSEYNGSLLMRPVFGSRLKSPVGISENGLSDVTFYPNPTSDYLQFISNQSGTYSIASLDGRNLMSGETTVGADVSSLPDGLYLVTILVNGQSITKKIIIRH